MYIIARKVCVKIIEERINKIRQTLDKHEKMRAEYIKVGNHRKANEMECQIKLDEKALEFICNLYVAFLY